MEMCNVVLAFQSVDEILWCDHSNEISLAVLLHSNICLAGFEKKNEIWDFLNFNFGHH